MANKPNNPSLWSKAKSLAKQKFDVYPSAYANGWAAKWYKSKGGTWSKAAEYGMEVMEDGGMPDNEGFKALPPDVQRKIMSNMEFGGMPYGAYAPPMFAAGGTPCYECGGMYADGGEADGGMALTQINAMMERLNNLRKYIKQDSDLDPWISDKLSVMNHSATAINDYMQYGEPQEEEMMEMAQGGGIPERYKNMGFTKVGVKKESTRPGKKWMVLAKKGDQYKVVHGGYDGMKDYTQHHNDDRRDRFWDRMGGKDSAKAKDPFSPLYWHKRFGTWAEGGELDMYDEGGDFYSGPYSDMYQEGDFQVDTVSKRRLENLEDNKWNRGLATATTLTDPRNMTQYLPKGSFLKGMIGLASGLSGATLGYEKMFAKDKHDSKLMNTGTEEYGNTQDILKARYDKANPTPPTPDPKDMNPDPRTKMTRTGGSGMGAVLENGNMYDDFSGASYDYTGGTDTPPTTTTSTSAPQMPAIPAGLNDYMNRGNVQTKRFGGLAQFDPGGEVTFQQWFAQNATRADVMANVSNQQALMEMWKKETGQNNTGNTNPNSGPLKFGQQPGPVASDPVSRPAGQPVEGTGPGSGMYNAMLGQQELEGALGDVAVGSGMGEGTAGSESTADPKVQMQKSWETTYRGDNAGFVAGNNAIVGLGYFADWAERRDQRKNNYDQQLRAMGNTDSMYNAYNPKNPFGNERTNMAVGPNSQLVMGTPLQDFSQVGAKYGGMKKYRQGGTYEVSPEEIMAILAAGGEIEYL